MHTRHPAALALLAMSLSGLAWAEQTTPSPAQVDPVARCIQYLESPAGERLLPTADASHLRSATCGCAVAGSDDAPQLTDPASRNRPVQRAALLHTCFAKALVATGNGEAGRADPLATAIALAIEPKDGPQGRYERAQFELGRRCESPAYPSASLRAEVTGTTSMAYFVDKDGVVKDAQILKSAGATPAHKLLDATALIAFMACRFTPAKQAGVPVDSWVAVTFNWILQ